MGASAVGREVPARTHLDRERLLAQRAGTRDAEAVAQLYALYHEPVTRYLQRMVGNEQDADDLAAEAFLKMVEATGRFRSQGVPFSSWVYRIAHNVGVDHFRARDRARLLNERLQTRHVSNPSAEEEALAAIAGGAMLARVNDLTSAQREVLVLRFVHVLSYREVAGILGKPEGTVKALQHRALAALKRCVDGEPGEELLAP